MRTPDHADADDMILMATPLPGAVTGNGPPQLTVVKVLVDPTFGLPERHIFGWQRRVSIDDWIIDLRSHSYVIDLDSADRGVLLSAVRAMLRQAFPTGMMEVPYQTRTWIARRS